MEFKVNSITSWKEASTNNAIIYDKDIFSKLGDRVIVKKTNYVKINNNLNPLANKDFNRDQVFDLSFVDDRSVCNKNVECNIIGLNKFVRSSLLIHRNDTLLIKPFTNKPITIDELQVNLSIINDDSIMETNYYGLPVYLNKIIRKVIKNRILYDNMYSFVFVYNNERYMMKIMNDKLKYGVIDKDTIITYKRSDNATILPGTSFFNGMFNPNNMPGINNCYPNCNTGTENKDKLKTKNKAKNDINFNWTFSELGIGGLDEQFASVFRRAFSSRLLSKKFVDEMNIQHTKGIILYGPPGTGKTLIARKLSKVLNADSIEIVNGPELLDKYVGGSENNLRDKFNNAVNGGNDELHVIIFDEIDSLFKVRGQEGGKVNDTIVNQMLTLMDGIETKNNFLVFGLTNRINLIDPALLRPGRFEIQIEIPLPKAKGRLQILKIKCESLIKNNRLDKDVDLEVIANKTKSFSGADLEGLVRSTISIAVAENTNDKLKVDEESVKIKFKHFMEALEDIRPINNDGLIHTNVVFDMNNNDMRDLYKSIENIFYVDKDEMNSDTINNYSQREGYVDIDSSDDTKNDKLFNKDAHGLINTKIEKNAAYATINKFIENNLINKFAHLNEIEMYNTTNVESNISNFFTFNEDCQILIITRIIRSSFLIDEYISIKKDNYFILVIG